MRKGPRPLSSGTGLAATALICVVAAAGCGLGPGDDAGKAELTITRDYGAEELEEATVELHESDTVMRVLDREAEIETRYGGAFVESVDGLAERSGARRSDWFFYVNGIESSLGAAEFRARDGDRIWWDYRDWTDALRTPALVGSWPEPFVHGFDGERWETAVICALKAPPSMASPCARTEQAVGRHVSSVLTPAGGGEVTRMRPARGAELAHILVGDWVAIRDDAVAGLLEEDTSSSGVFARFEDADGAVRLELLSERGEVVETLGPRAGLVAALRPADGPPTWVVTGTDAAGVTAAADLLGEPLRNHYALAVAGGEPIPVPVP